MKYKPVIGIEVHAQLLTRTKLFCSCRVDWQAPPNTLTCPVCLGMPGTLPVLNKKAVELAIKAALALNCEIKNTSVFARKNYFYPDLPKGYQITQYEKPLARNGNLDVDGKRIRIRRVHLEEDAGKLIHLKDKTLIDFNRCGTPLIEIVTEPDITSPEMAHSYLSKLRSILRYCDICNGDMEKGSLRCEPNISILVSWYPGVFEKTKKPRNKETKKLKLGTRTEIKNLNSLKAVQKGLEYEIKRQTGLLESGRKVVQKTFLWNEKEQRTKEMRTKEEAEDYRYFPEPDLPPLVIDNKWVDEIKQTIPELPDAKLKRFIEDYKIRELEAKIITEDKSLADYFEEVIEFMVQGSRFIEKDHQLPTINYELIAFFITGEVQKVLNKRKMEIEQLPVKSKDLAELFNLIKEGVITLNLAKDIFTKMVEEKKTAREIVEEKGLKQITSKKEIENIAKEVLKSHPAEVERYRKGKKGLFGYFIGEVMRKTKGKANPRIVNAIMLDILKNKWETL